MTKMKISIEIEDHPGLAAKEAFVVVDDFEAGISIQNYMKRLIDVVIVKTRDMTIEAAAKVAEADGEESREEQIRRSNGNQSFIGAKDAAKRIAAGIRALAKKETER
jgi:hypothetical protein